MTAYKLSEAAAEDFEAIFEFGIEQFGLAKALDYQLGMKKRFDAIAYQPKQYPAINHIRLGYFRSVYGSHSIYYRLDKEHILIVRILGKQDIKTELQESESAIKKTID